MRSKLICHITSKNAEDSRALVALQIWQVHATWNWNLKKNYISSSSTTSYKGPTVRFLRGYGWFQKKISCRLISREKISCRLISREKISCKEIHGQKYPALKKISLMAYTWKKSYTIIFPGKISGSRGLGKRFLPKPNHLSRPHPSKVEW